MRALVPEPLHVLHEGPAVLGAAVGLLAAVDAPVHPVHREVGALAEGLAAHVARERLLPGVHAPVRGQRGVLAEPSSALAAREGLFQGVLALMLLQLGPLREGLPALPAHAGLLAARDSSVALPVRIPRVTTGGPPPF